MENKAVIDIFDYKLDNSENIENAFKFLSDQYLISEEKEQRLIDKLRRLLSKFRVLYQTANRKRERFDSKFSDWLHSSFCIEEFIKDNNDSVTSSAGKRGRPRSSFLNSSDRSKRRNINNEILDPKVDSTEKALLLARRVAYNDRNTNLVKVIGHMLKNQDNFGKMFVKLTNDQEII